MEIRWHEIFLLVRTVAHGRKERSYDKRDNITAATFLILQFPRFVIILRLFFIRNNIIFILKPILLPSRTSLYIFFLRYRYFLLSDCLKLPRYL